MANTQQAKAAGSGSLRVTVIGAGLAGLNAARVLSARGHRVSVVEKARGAGGRMSTRRHGAWRFDHGAQYFTARDGAFRGQVDEWLGDGLAARWEPRIAVVENDTVRAARPGTERYVAVPGMSAICSRWVSALDDVRYGWRVSAAQFRDGTWTLESADGEVLRSDALIVTAPPDQAAALISDPEVDESVSGVQMQPCWAVMAVFDRPLLPHWDAAFVNQGPLSWVAGQDSRPGRPLAHAWVLHAGAAWSEVHSGDATGSVAEQLVDAARSLPGAGRVHTEFVRTHFWRYALAAEPLECGFLPFPLKRLALAGDWCHGSRIEGAFLSGAEAADWLDGS